VENIVVLGIKFNFGEVQDVIHPVILQDDKNMVLVDCGYTGFLPKIEQAMKDVNLDCNQLTHVVITHQDHDHMGAAAKLKEKYPNILIVASKEESRYISGEMKSLRLEQAEEMQSNLPEEQKAFGLAFCKILRNVEPVSVDIMVHDSDIFEWCGGCTVISTKGHTPGHISLYLNKKKVLITGDAAALENGELVIANPQFTLKLEDAQESLNKILGLDAQEIICYHGGRLKL
jgi:glyoxylase-like metal-dependent hydrolase (beta-lactamase superfamily II)